MTMKTAKPLTPTESFSDLLEKGCFELNEIKRHSHDIPLCQSPLRPIPIIMFGEYFMKCTGTLNSVIKRGDIKEGSNTQMVVKDKIGFRNVINGKGNGNSHYAFSKNAYAILHPDHINLVSKRSKRESVEDFWKLKEEFILKFHNLKAQLNQFVNSGVLIGDVFDIGYKNPTGSNYTYNHSGYTTLNSRVVSNKCISFSMETTGDFFDNYNSLLDSPLDSSDFTNGNVDIKAILTESITDDFGKPMDKSVCLFSINIYGTSFSKNPTAPKIRMFNHKFDGIDIPSIINFICQEYSKFYPEFVEKLNGLRDKYLAEYMLNEICDENSNTAI